MRSDADLHDDLDNGLGRDFIGILFCLLSHTLMFSRTYLSFGIVSLSIVFANYSLRAVLLHDI